MIATGGLLRMNRRQDSLRSKNRAENKRKRKAKKKKKNDVVVVKGKLNLCSPAGFVAAVGVVVLMVGISMAVLGYWPSQTHQDYQERRRTGAHRANRMSYSQTPSLSSNLTRVNPPSTQAHVVNQSHANSSVPDPSPSCGFLCDFLDRYLYSDNLKVFGPLVMGIGIFLFICANAVLHENRDKKTKIINLRDIYSTVIDLHSIRSKEYSPLTGLVNYTQSRSAEVPAVPYNASSGVLTRSSWPFTGLGFPGELGGDELFRRPSLASRPRSWSRDVQTFTDTVYSIYRDYSNSSEQTPQPRQWETTSIVTSSVNAFTLPVIKLNNYEVGESDRAEAERSSEEGLVSEAAEDVQAGCSHGAEMVITEQDASITDSLPPQQNHQALPSDTDDQQGAPQDQPKPQWTQKQLFPPSPVARAMGSRLSLNSVTDQPRSARRCSLSASVSRQGDRARRFSCPRLERSNSKGYIKLADLGGESFEAPDTDTSLLATDQEVAAAAAAAAQGEEDLVTPSTSLDS
ncbi:transmembrane protein 200C-like [Diretmus argenteus]